MSNEKIKSLQEQIADLRSKLKVEIYKVVQDASRELVRELLASYGVTGKTAVLQWDFEEEYDDEGGTVWYPYNIRLDVDGNGINIDELSIERPSKYIKDTLFECYLEDDLHDFLNGIKNQLTDYAEDEQFEFNIEGPIEPLFEEEN